ncbi:PPK2 family polyphosphate kinase [Salinibacterium hongtaonis]|uniref:Phosphate--nucleotide phosphotransferase n=1 Tax=Homoserinimonas hongtaonis TaxID=2079791 RepID=A0A2U1T2I0_9MICO|nr:PPK2 family polyphosphate kinase [Salinibacterium hongtaonis]PWB98058.1 phosphate--nucleotide phosphotransferase [Salinibacterium hongtaonis]
MTESSKSAEAVWAAEPSTLLRVGPHFRLSDVDPAATPGFDGDEADGKRELRRTNSELADLQERLWAESRFGGERSVLLLLQAMDTAGKGGILRHVVGGVDPQGISIHAFKAPTEAEKAHDFLWRVRRELPAAGMIGVFDRSHYEDVLIHRVRGFSPPDVIERRYGMINDFESQVEQAGTSIIKVMLHISHDEQKRRLSQRLERPEKNWKYNPGDVDERMFWPDYMDAYQAAFERTSTDVASWHVVPADHKWYARVAVQRLLLQTLREIDPHWPAANYDVEFEKKRLAAS